ncbi:glycosyltransferase family 2 protein [Maridesulfovibrio sp.]|uniref:glycosyltransferase family 2 protein n=1 Tax=Maridesulfovibrio sp. TaxID=2795000 RepID=UPI003BAB5498
MLDSVVVIIPAFNEAESIGSIVRENVAFGYSTVVVDDCSTDSTFVVAREAGAEVIQLPCRSGAWAAIQAGMLYAYRKKKYDLFVTMDADGQHQPQFISLLLENYDRLGVNVIIGSCIQRGSLARRLVWHVFYLLTRLKIRDMTSGFKLYDRQAVEILLSPKAVLFDYQDLGPLLLLRRHGCKFYETSMHMPPRQNGRSRIFNSWLSVFVYLFKTFIWVLSDWLSKPEDSTKSRSGYDSI